MGFEVSLWVPVVAALGAAALTSFTAWLLEVTRQRAAARASAVAARRSAYLGLTQAANRVLMAGQAMQTLLRVRSGLGASLSELLRLRASPDPAEVTWRLVEEVRPLLDAQAEVLSLGTPEAAAASKELADSATAYMRAVTATTRTQRWVMGLVPWTPTEDQVATAARQLERTGHAVECFVSIVRRDLAQSPLNAVETGKGS